MKEVVIVSACRTAVGGFGGSLRDLHLTQIGATVMKEAVVRAGIDAGMLDDVRFGCCREPSNALNSTRVAALLAGIPEEVTAVTVNRVCISGMEAVVSGMAMIQAGMGDIVLVGGMEHMSGISYSVPTARWGCRFQDQVFVDDVVHSLHAGSHILPGVENGPIKDGEIVERFRGKPYIMGITAELIAYKHGLSREEIDEVALRSHNNAERATTNGDFGEEIVPVVLPPKKKGGEPGLFNKDEHFRPGLTMADLAKLPSAFVAKVGKVTAGNSSGVNDGASAMVIMSADKAKELGIKPIARIKAVGRGGCHPSVMGLSPVPAVADLLKKSGLKLADFELLELNEAFAAQYLGCERELGLNREITNVNGSGVGLGHPVGSTGCRIMVTLLHAMKHRGKGLGMATLCGGGGVSLATAIEMV
ncbi:MAG: acetyl-CoA C-acyltransferase [Deltaproteobacteria bacterium]|nr:acetyl-CoA C-acyltransferase [Deltaproteobacteria bacterium]